MEIKQETIENTGRFYIAESNDILAEIDYRLIDKHTLLIVHTQVDKSQEGKGVGRHLVTAAVDYARTNFLMINATCSFAKELLDSSPEFADVYNAEKK
jgi:hypothetical protein